MNIFKFLRNAVFTGLLVLTASLLLSACASYGGRGLKPGESTLAEVEATRRCGRFCHVNLWMPSMRPACSITREYCSLH